MQEKKHRFPYDGRSDSIRRLTVHVDLRRPHLCFHRFLCLVVFHAIMVAPVTLDDIPDVFDIVHQSPDRVALE